MSHTQMRHLSHTNDSFVSHLSIVNTERQMSHTQMRHLSHTNVSSVSHLCIVNPPKNGLIALWPSTNGAIPHFLVLPGSELSISEITEYTYFSPLKPSREFTC